MSFNFDEARKILSTKGVPLKDVYKEAQRERILFAQKWLKDNYGIHPKSEEALARYEKLVEKFHESYGENAELPKPEQTSLDL